MELSARLYNCAACHSQIIICSHCDRNHIYCGSACSRAARVRSCYLAGSRYQLSFRGRLKHAQRQRRYRERIKIKVTHHSSPVLPPRDVLPKLPNKPISDSEAVSRHYHCHFCGGSCSLFLRRGFLRHLGQDSSPRSPSWPLAP